MEISLDSLEKMKLVKSSEEVPEVSTLILVLLELLGGWRLLYLSGGAQSDGM